MALQSGAGEWFAELTLKGHQHTTTYVALLKQVRSLAGILADCLGMNELTRAA
jgi:hypothetical protein